ncbi:MAG: hypothetical protein ACYCW6_05595 [Candidatus Xenobia bacterium]
MPRSLEHVDALNALYILPQDSPWRKNLKIALMTLASPKGFQTTGQYARRENRDKVASHLTLLEERLSGKLQWTDADAYGAGLLEEGTLPLYTAGSLHYTMDLWNPNNEANDAAYDSGTLILELIMHRDFVYPRPLLEHPDDPQEYAKLAEYGRVVNHIFSIFAELLEPKFAFADIEYTGASVPGNWWDYLWPLSVWSPELLDEARLKKLRATWLTKEEEATLHPLERVAIQPVWRTLTNRAFCLQTRQILGVPGGVPREADRLLAAHADLRSPVGAGVSLP